MNLDFTEILNDVQRALAEDIGPGDATAMLLPSVLHAQAVIISREPMFVCGQPWVNAVFAEVDPSIVLHWQVAEGQWLTEPATLCHIEGNARNLLTAERTALNFLQTLSATATATHDYMRLLQGYKTRLLDTRKTLPGLRRAQKYAVSCAGGMNHRMGLFDAFLIKENHIKACGTIAAAIELARNLHKNILIEIEVESLKELQEALNAKPDRIMLDNFTHAMICEAVAINQSYGVELEVSGGVNLSTLQAIAATGVDYVSIGAITKSIQAIDLSLLIKDIK